MLKSYTTILKRTTVFLIHTTLAQDKYKYACMGKETNLCKKKSKILSSLSQVRKHLFDNNRDYKNALTHCTLLIFPFNKT